MSNPSDIAPLWKSQSPIDNGVNTASGIDLAPSGNKPLPEPIRHTAHAIVSWPHPSRMCWNLTKIDIWQKMLKVGVTGANPKWLIDAYTNFLC